MFQLGICTVTKEQPRKTWPVAGSCGCIHTSGQESGFRMCELYRQSLFVQLLCIKTHTSPLAQLLFSSGN